MNKLSVKFERGTTKEEKIKWHEARIASGKARLERLKELEAPQLLISGETISIERFEKDLAILREN